MVFIMQCKKNLHSNLLENLAEYLCIDSEETYRVFKNLEKLIKDNYVLAGYWLNF